MVEIETTAKIPEIESFKKTMKTCFEKAVTWNGHWSFAAISARDDLLLDLWTGIIAGQSDEAFVYQFHAERRLEEYLPLVDRALSG